MKSSNKTLLLALLVGVLLLPIGIISKATDGAQNKQAKIQVALLLDTSSSMSGLIEQTKSQLWNMVNELSTARKFGKAPNIELALYEYGNSRLSGTNGYIRRITEFTTDLDQVSAELFALTTNGGSEHCGQVIKAAHDELEWSKASDDLRLVFIAGNEAFTQGPVNYEDACKSAIQAGIVVNTIFCGGHESGISGLWKAGADLADGKYMSINHNQQVVHIETPFDTTLNNLNRKLNTTYIGYGSLGATNVARQQTQDVNARQYGATNLASRAVTKASANYRNSSWDLVDAFVDNKKVLDEVKKEQLPANMQKMNRSQQVEYIERNLSTRNAVRQQIIDLDKQRKEYIAKERRKKGETNTLDNAMMNTMRELATDHDFKFEP